MLTIDDLLRATRGTLLQGKPSVKIKEITTDSRNVKRGDLFISIVGERFDAHRFLPDVIQKGAKALVVSRKVDCPKDISLILVDDTTKALGQIAAFYRQRFKIPVIAITGSAGKTTTKEMIAAVLSSKFYVLKNEKTENNHFGVPLTLLKLRKKHQMVVLELGTNQPGDIKYLAQIVRPTVAVFTNIGDSHLERLKNREGVFKEKFMLVKSLSHKGIIILNQDDVLLSKILKKNVSQDVRTYSIDHSSEFQAKEIRLTKDNQIAFKVDATSFELNGPAQHNVYNALAAICCGKIFKVGTDKIKKSLSDFHFSNGRQEIQKIGKIHLINDTYNSNPVSFKSAVRTLDAFQSAGRKVIVCADMLELGEKSRKLHEDMGKFIAQFKIAMVITIGSMAKDISKSLKKENKNIQTFHCEAIEDVHKLLSQNIQPHDTILVKGSRGMAMERVVECLKNRFNHK